MKTILPKLPMLKGTASAVIIATCLSPISAAAQEEILYQERWINISGSNFTLEDPGFPDTLEISTRDRDDFVQEANDFHIGVEINFDDTDFGYLFNYQSTQHQDHAYVLNVPISRSGQELTRIEFYQRQPNSDWRPSAEAAKTHLIVKIADQWYVSEEQKVTEGAPDADRVWVPHSFTFTTDAAAWREFTYTVVALGDADFAIGDVLTSDLPGGDIQAWGFFCLSQASDGIATEMDEFTVYGEASAVETWMGYTILDDDWVDTQEWLGWVNVIYRDVNYVWVNAFESYSYIPDDSGWIWVSK